MTATQKKFKARTQQKRDVENLWETNNPTLLEGEIAIVDTSDYGVRLKVGDGTTPYTNLPFAGGRCITVSEILDANLWSEQNTYSFETTYPSSKFDLSIEVSNTATILQCEAFTNAMICGSATSNDIKALNGKPSINIPIILRITYR